MQLRLNGDGQGGAAVMDGVRTTQRRWTARWQHNNNGWRGRHKRDGDVDAADNGGHGGQRSIKTLNVDHQLKINKLLNKLLQILLCTIWTDKGLLIAVCEHSKAAAGRLEKPQSGLSLWYQSNKTLGSVGKPVTG